MCVYICIYINPRPSTLNPMYVYIFIYMAIFRNCHVEISERNVSFRRYTCVCPDLAARNDSSFTRPLFTQHRPFHVRAISNYNKTYI